MSEIAINNKDNSPISKKFVKNTIDKTIKFLKQQGKSEKKDIFELSVAFVSKSEIQTLNSRYRKRDEPTDVLSFMYDEEGLNGELILCYDIIKGNAIEIGTSVEDELCKNIIHGILHINGLEHGSEMFELQDLIFSEICQSGNFKK